MFYFVGILSGVEDIFLPNCRQIFSPLKVRFKGISEPYKSPVQSDEYSYNRLYK